MAAAKEDSGTVWDAPNQQVVRKDASAPWDEGDGGEPGENTPEVPVEEKPQPEPQPDEPTPQPKEPEPQPDPEPAPEPEAQPK